MPPPPLLQGRRSPVFPSRADLQPMLLLVVSGTALALASVSLLLAASSWGRNLCLSRDLQEGSSNTGPQPQEHYGPSWNREGFLYRFSQEGKARNRRTANRKNSHRNRKAGAASAAAHYEVKSGTSSPQAQADRNGVIKDWIEVKLNSTNPLSYNNLNGEFKVTKKGLYYLYCQVHFHEGKSIYVKLDISLDGEVAFRCLEEFSTTAASIQEAEVKVCQVSGLVLLQPNSVILIKTIKDVSLKTERYLTYFGLFQVH